MTYAFNVRFEQKDNGDWFVAIRPVGSVHETFGQFDSWEAVMSWLTWKFQEGTK